MTTSAKFKTGKIHIKRGVVWHVCLNIFILVFIWESCALQSLGTGWIMPGNCSLKRRQHFLFQLRSRTSHVYESQENLLFFRISQVSLFQHKYLICYLICVIFCWMYVYFCSSTLSIKRNITTSERHSLKSKSSKWIIFGHRIAISYPY